MKRVEIGKQAHWMKQERSRKTRVLSGRRKKNQNKIVKNSNLNKSSDNILSKTNLRKKEARKNKVTSETMAYNTST